MLVTGLTDTLPGWHETGNRILLTSRPYGIDQAGLARLGLPQAPLEALPREMQDLFVNRWFQTLGKQEKIDELIATIRGRNDLDPLVANPMLLAAICVLYDNGGRLPDDRYDLYRDIVANVLHNRYPDDVGQRGPVERRLEAVALGMHEGDARNPRTTPAAEIGWDEVERLLARFAEGNPAYESGQVEAATRREELLNRSGLLVPRQNERAGFYHLSFQEFLAARRIARTTDDIEQVFRDRGTVAEWRPTLLFLIARQIADRDADWGLRLLERLIADQDRAAVRANAAPAAFIAEALDHCLSKGFEVPPGLAQSFRRLALDAIEDEVALSDRLALGLTLGRVGDPRILGLRDPAGYIEVPAGTYLYGGKLERRVQIEQSFRIGRYPVTNQQYREFVDDGGYRERRWWSEEGWDWARGKGVVAPDYWGDWRWNAANQPVVGVSFWEAEACSRWAGGRLPRQEEWEAATRGSHGLKYPWGNKWRDGISNTIEAGVVMTTPVGLFPSSRQADSGIEDLVGNVWEWCDSIIKVGDEDAETNLNLRRVLRGGPGNAAAAFRGARPDVRDLMSGFRVVCSSPSPGTDP